MRAYLNEFLMDPYVIDLPWPLRRLLVSLFILPTRPRASAEAYASIWGDRGSPLLYHCEDLCRGLSERIDRPVYLAMRYGSPGIGETMQTIAANGHDQLTVLPLYPQYADSTITTSVQAVQQAAAAVSSDLAVTIVLPFYQHPGYVDAFADQIRRHIDGELGDDCHLLMSFHGLPEKHLTRADPTGQHCLKQDNCCETPSPSHKTCYRHQSFVSAHLIARAAGIDPSRYSVSFQSRLGRLPWLKPYTDERIRELASEGVRKLFVVCPAFVADNLETLEEIAIQGKEIFQEAGGENLVLIPCLNADAKWIDALAEIVA